ncbi:hypothetical protein THAOC_27339, partial [Thalassiosira oceanica]
MRYKVYPETALYQSKQSIHGRGVVATLRYATAPQNGLRRSGTDPTRTVLGREPGSTKRCLRSEDVGQQRSGSDFIVAKVDEAAANGGSVWRGRRRRRRRPWPTSGGATSTISISYWNDFGKTVALTGHQHQHQPGAAEADIGEGIGSGGEHQSGSREQGREPTG